MDLDWAPDRVRRNFRIDLASGICAGIYLSVLVAFMPVVVRRMGGSATEVALVVAGPFVGHLLSPLLAYLLSSFRPVRLVAGTVTLSRLVFVAGVLLATGPAMLAATTVVTWIIAIANTAAYTSLMAGIYPDRERASAMSRVRMGVSVAGIASAALAGAFIDAVPAAWVFAAAALVSLPGALAFFAIRHDGHAAAAIRRPVAAIARDVWADRRYRGVLLSFLLFGTGNLMNAAMFPLLLVDHFDASNTFIGLFAALQAATQVVALPFVGAFIDRGSSLRFTLYNSLFVLVIPLGYLVAPSVWWLLPVAVVGGIANAGGDLTFHTNLVQLAPRGRVAEYAYAQSLLLGLRGTAAPFAASLLIALVAPRGVLVVGLGFMVAGVTLMSLAIAREPELAPELLPVART